MKPQTPLCLRFLPAMLCCLELTCELTSSDAMTLGLLTEPFFLPFPSPIPPRGHAHAGIAWAQIHTVSHLPWEEFRVLST